MALKRNQHVGLTTPLRNRAGQCGQKQVVDLCAIGRWRFAEQRVAARRIQLHMQLLHRGLQRLALRVGARQLRRRWQVAPVVGFRQHGVAVGEVEQAIRPTLERQALLAEVDGQAGLCLGVRVMQVLQQDAPRNAVHHQVMDDQQ